MMDHSWHTPLEKVALASPTPWSSSSSDSSQHHSVPSSPRAPLCAATSDLHRPISISPPSSLSPVDHHYPLFDLPIGNTQGDASKVTMRCRDTDVSQKSTASTPQHKYESTGMSMEELATVGKWIADTQEELKKTRGVGNLLGPPPSRLSAIIQGLSTGTFDEDKYIISRRVDQHIDRVFRNAVINDKEGKRVPSTSCNVPPVSRCSIGPCDHEAKPYMSAAPSQCDQDPKPDKPQIPPQAQPVSYFSKQPLPHPVTRPPPLFMPSLNTQRPSDPLEPLQGYVFKGKKRHKNKRRHNKNIGVQTTNLIKEQTSNNTEEKMKDISTHPHPDTPRNDGAEELKGVSDVSKTNRRMQDLKLKLKISSQASVNIPRENTTLLLPGISITPRDLPVRQSQDKNMIIEVIHESMKEDPLSLRISSQTEDNQPDNSDKYNKELNDEASQMIFSNSNADVERSLSNVAYVLQVKTNGEEDHQLHNDQTPLVEETNNNKPDIVYVIDYNEKDKHNRQQGLSNNFGVDDDNRSSDNEIESLPKVKWKEVVVEECRDENDENIQKVLYEAEDRLCQYDLKLRILQRLEKRLRDLVQIEPTPAAVPDAQIEFVPVLSQDNHQDKQCDDQTQFPLEARTAVRAVLEGLVRERLNAAALQVKDNDTEEEAISPCHSLSQDKSSSTSQINAPSDSHHEALPESHGLEQIRTPSPSPSPPKEEASPRRLLTPQLSHEEEKASEDVATPPPSPTFKVPMLDIKYQVTPSVTPGSSPGKVRKNVTPECTPRVSPFHLGNVVQQPNTPTESPTPQQALDEEMEAHHIPTPTSSASSPTPYKPPKPDSVGSLSSSSQAMAERSIPRLLDQSTQAHMTDRTPAAMEDVETQVSYEDNRNFAFPETPSIICQSSTDITVSSLAEASDVTCYTVSDGEIISGAAVVNTSVEEGEVALTQHLHYLTSDSARTTAFINKTTEPNRACVQCSKCQNVMSEGELELDESSEGLLSMEDHESGKDQQVTSEESQVELLQPSQIIATPVDSLQVSVVQNESYSSGDATTLSNDDLTKLREENSQLLFRLRNFGSFSFLTKNFQSFHSSSSSSS